MLSSANFIITRFMILNLNNRLLACAQEKTEKWNKKKKIAESCLTCATVNALMPGEKNMSTTFRRQTEPRKIIFSFCTFPFVFFLFSIVFSCDFYCNSMVFLFFCVLYVFQTTILWRCFPSYWLYGQKSNKRNWGRRENTKKNKGKNHFMYFRQLSEVQMFSKRFSCLGRIALLFIVLHLYKTPVLKWKWKNIFHLFFFFSFIAKPDSEFFFLQFSSSRFLNYFHFCFPSIFF